MGSEFITSIGHLKNMLSFYELAAVLVQILVGKKGAAAPFSISVIQRLLFHCFDKSELAETHRGSRFHQSPLY